MIWAVVWSGILTQLFNLSPWKWQVHGQPASDLNKGLDFTADVLFCILGGLVAGQFVLAYRHSFRAPATSIRHSRFRLLRFLAALFNPTIRDYSSVIDRHLNLECRGRWVVVECRDGKIYFGELYANDARWSEDFTVSLNKARTVEISTGGIGLECLPVFHLKSDDILHIKPYIPQAPPAPKEGRLKAFLATVKARKPAPSQTV